MRRHTLLRCVVALLAVPPAVIAQDTCDRGAAEAKTAEASTSQAGAPRAAMARTATALCASYAPAHNALGTALEEMGDHAGAAEAYRTAARLDPAWYLPQLGLGDLSRAVGNEELARRHYREAVALARTDRERQTAEQALAEVPERNDAYSFKNAEAIARGLRLNETTPKPSTRGFGAAEAVQEEYYEAADGLAANFSILFEVRSADLLPEGAQQLDEVGKALRSSGADIRFRVEGHASTDGDPGFNLALSRRRAERVRDYLASSFGIPASRLEATGRGSASPVMEAGRENRQKSRRVALIRIYDAN